jgi:predicted DsbA family dithiol-disulfide isomerase
VERLFRAYFTEQQSVFDQQTLVNLGADAGLNRDEVAAALRDNRYALAVDADIDIAHRLGVSGVPFYVINDRYGISGAQAPEAFLDVLQRAAADHQSVG